MNAHGYSSKKKRQTTSSDHYAPRKKSCQHFHWQTHVNWWVQNGHWIWRQNEENTKTYSKVCCIHFWEAFYLFQSLKWYGRLISIEILMDFTTRVQGFPLAESGFHGIWLVDPGVQGIWLAEPGFQGVWLVELGQSCDLISWATSLAKEAKSGQCWIPQVA